jgi:hypothetical protein
MIALLFRLWALKKIWNLVRSYMNNRNRPQPNTYRPKLYQQPNRYQTGRPQ